MRKSGNFQKDGNLFGVQCLNEQGNVVIVDSSVDPISSQFDLKILLPHKFPKDGMQQYLRF